MFCTFEYERRANILQRKHLLPLLEVTDFKFSGNMKSQEVNVRNSEGSLPL
jgi:hypothetical protein